MSKSCWFITGTSQGLGKAIAEAVLRIPNTEVAGYARRQAFENKHYTHHTVDLSDLSAVKKITFSLPLHCDTAVLINNAGSLGEMAFTGMLDAEKMHQVYQLNAITPHILSNAFIAAFDALPIKKVIINITSGAAQNAYAGWSEYCATKAAVDMQTLCMAKEQAAEHIKNPVQIYAIAPGVMDTDMQTKIRATDVHDFPAKEKFVGLHENKQLYSTQAVADWYVRFVQTCDGTAPVIQRVTL